MLRILPVTETVWPDILRIQAESYPASILEDGEVMRSKWRVSPQTCAVCVDAEGDVLGYVLSHPWAGNVPPSLHQALASPADCRTWHLHDLAIGVAARGRGVAGRLVTHLLGQARQAGIEGISLVAIQGAETFWSRHGFTEKAESTAAFDSYGTAAVWMTCALTETGS